MKTLELLFILKGHDDQLEKKRIEEELGGNASGENQSLIYSRTPIVSDSQHIQGLMDAVSFTKLAFGIGSQKDQNRFNEIYSRHEKGFDKFYDDFSFTVNDDYEMNRGLLGEARERMYVASEAIKDTVFGSIDMAATAVEGLSGYALNKVGVLDDQSYENYRGYYEEDANAIMDGIRNIGNPNLSQNTLLKPIYGVVNNAGSYMSPTASYNELKEYSNSVIQTGMTVYGGATVLKGIGTAASGISYGSGQMSLANSMVLSPGISTSVEAGVLLEGMNTSFQGSGILMAESIAGSGDSGGTSGTPSEGISKTLANPYDLQPTHGQTLSNRKMNKLVDQIKENGIQETIKYVEVDGIKYVVDGHHRVIAAKKLCIKEVPIEQVELPYLGYKTVEDLFWYDY